jgi:hypothetical protein
MNWYIFAVSLSVGSLGGFAAYWLLKARLRRQASAGLELIEWPKPHLRWGLDMECGIHAVNSEGEVIGIVLVPAPALN